MKITSTEVKNSFGKYLRLCANEPVYITKNGKTIAKLLNHTDIDEIIEESVNLRKVYHVEQNHYRDYGPDRVAESSAAYNLKPFRMSLEEFHEMNESATARYEYIDGEVYMLASPTVYHQRIISKLHIAFDHYLKGKPCDVFESPFDVTLLRRGKEDFTNIVQPDLLVICDWKKDLDEKGKYTGIPNVVVEVVSPSNSIKEMMTKLDLYRDSGIKEYWLVNDRMKLLMVYTFKDYDIAHTAVFHTGEMCQSRHYKGFEISMDDLIEDEL